MLRIVDFRIPLLVALLGVLCLAAAQSTTTAIATGDSHSLALRSDGTVWAVGANGSGELGDGTTTNRRTPERVSGLTSIQAIAVGDDHSLALSTNGTVWAWGNNEYGQLGDGTNTNRSTPVQVTNLINVQAIAAGDEHSIALLMDGTVWAWGRNEFGQLGNNTTSDRNIPVPVRLDESLRIQAIAASGNHSMALQTDGTVWAWGEKIRRPRSIPGRIPNLTGVQAIAAGPSHSLALRSDGSISAWGSNLSGELGDGTTNYADNPVQVAGLTNVTAIAAGSTHSVAVRSDGTVFAWGGNRYGQLGDATKVNSSSPQEIKSLTGVQTVAAAGRHSLALKTDGSVTGWGEDYFGQLGVTSLPSPPPVSASAKPDSFAGASVIQGDRGSASASSAGSTIEPGERWQSLNDPGGASLWWTWEAPANGQVVFDTNGSDFDTILGLYSGTSITTLEMLAENDDADGVQSRVTANVNLGRLYRVRVDGYEGASGNVKLNWRLTPTTTRNNTAQQTPTLTPQQIASEIYRSVRITNYSSAVSVLFTQANSPYEICYSGSYQARPVTFTAITLGQVNATLRRLNLQEVTLDERRVDRSIGLTSEIASQPNGKIEMTLNIGTVLRGPSTGWQFSSLGICFKR
jgi:alpha-tubulin suppressor-like RCC1 family protein